MTSRSAVEPPAGRAQEKPWPGLLATIPVGHSGAGPGIGGRGVHDEAASDRTPSRPPFALPRWSPSIP
jgi:hypothetical protein